MPREPQPALGSQDGAAVAEEVGAFTPLLLGDQPVGHLQGPPRSGEVSDFEKRRVERLGRESLLFAVSRLRSFLDGLAGNQEGLPVAGPSPGEVKEPVEDCRGPAMIPRGAAQGQIAMIGPLRGLDLSSLLVDGRRQTPHPGTDLAGLLQPVHPGHHLIAMSQGVVGADESRSRPRITVRFKGRGAPLRRRLVPVRGRQVETPLDSALPAGREEGGETEGPPQGAMLEHRPMMAQV